VVLGEGLGAGAVTVRVTVGRGAGALAEPHPAKPAAAASTRAGMTMSLWPVIIITPLVIGWRECSGPGACFGDDFLIEEPAPVPPGLLLIAGRLQPSGGPERQARAARRCRFGQPRNSGHESFAMNYLL